MFELNVQKLNAQLEADKRRRDFLRQYSSQGAVAPGSPSSSTSGFNRAAALNAGLTRSEISVLDPDEYELRAIQVGDQNLYFRVNKNNPEDMTQLPGIGGARNKSPTTNVQIVNPPNVKVGEDYAPRTDAAGNLIKDENGRLQVYLIPGSPTDINLRAEFSRSAAAVDSYESMIDRAKTFADQARPLINDWTTSFLSGLIEDVPNTDASKLKQALVSLENMQFFAKLAELKGASSSGASGMGQLTEREGERLEKAYANLSRARGAKALRRALDELIAIFDDQRKKMRQTLNNDINLGIFGPPERLMGQQPESGGVSQASPAMPSANPQRRSASGFRVIRD